MKVRSITLFVPTFPTSDQSLAEIAPLGATAREALEVEGYEVQTVRLATPPWPRFFPESTSVLDAARWLDQAAPAWGVEYVSLGPVEAVDSAQREQIALIPQILAATSRIFCTVLLARRGKGINLEATRAAAEVIHACASLEPDGFANLRFAALANVGAGSPFFPAAYAEPLGATGEQGKVGVALALESADLAVEAYQGARSAEQAMAALTERLEAEARGLTRIMEPLSEAHGARFLGLDFSLAPFPDSASSVAGAIESLGARPFGAMGTLGAAALTTQALQQARYPRCGFSGLMLPVLEDTVLAQRAGEGSYGLHSLLLFSAVCGTGLDTVPLHGDISVDTLAAILFDVAALALRLDKPLTARLMPIPGKRSGERTQFSFPFFANGTVLPATAPEGTTLLAGGLLPLRPTPAEPEAYQSRTQ